MHLKASMVGQSTNCLEKAFASTSMTLVWTVQTSMMYMTLVHDRKPTAQMSASHIPTEQQLVQNHPSKLHELMQTVSLQVGTAQDAAKS